MLLLTSEPHELAYEHEWAAHDSLGQSVCDEYELGRGRPVMYCPEANILMFEAPGEVLPVVSDRLGPL